MLLRHVGAWPARRVTWALVILFSAWVLLDVLVLHVSSGLAQSSYDAMVRGRFYAAPPDSRIVIVDIDESSLLRMGTEFGRWPWPRDTLATVLDHVEKQQPAAILWDIVFSDADRLSPGGDAAFNAAAKRSTHSHFSVVRLPPKNDVLSQVTQKELPGLWLSPPASPGPAVALIAPALPAVAGASLGFNNGYVDKDGVLRRFRYTEMLSDGSIMQSLPVAVARTLAPAAAAATLAGSINASGPDARDELIVWRKTANAYPTLSFADVFAQADGGAPLKPVPAFTGKIVIIGSTAPSLHDVHPTPLSPIQAGVDSLATAVDNAVNGHQLAELPRWLQAVLAACICVGIGLWISAGRSLSSLAPALFWLPASLLGISYLSLNGLPVFIDLHIAAGLGLVFLAVLRIWNGMHRQYWCRLDLPDAADGSAGTYGVWPWRSSNPWRDGALDRLIDAVARHAPDCRIITHDINITWPASMHWPELAGYIAITGPHRSLTRAAAALEKAITAIYGLADLRQAPMQTLPAGATRQALCAAAMSGWKSIDPPVSNPPLQTLSTIHGTTP